MENPAYVPIFKKNKVACSCSNEEGLSLISTLWILTLLSILATQLLYSIHLEQRAQRNFLHREKFHYAARAGFEWALALLRDDQIPFDALGENWGEPIEGQIEDGIQGGNLLTYSVNIIDEASKINLNTADVSLILNLLVHIGANPDDAFTQELANNIVEGQPYRTVRALAGVDDMSAELLYGVQQNSSAPVQSTTQQEETAIPVTETGTRQENIPTSGIGLVHLATVYSIDTNTDAEGQERVNVNTAESSQLTQIQGNNGPVFTPDEAESFIQQREFDQIAALVDIQAVSDELFNSVRARLTTQGNEEQDNQEKEQQAENGQININTADIETLQSLEGIDEGIAQRIVAHRNSQGNFQNIDALKEVKMLTQDEFVSIADKVTIKDEETLSGLININTAPPETLALLPGMDGEKAQAIVARREEEVPNTPEIQNLTAEEIKGNPFTAISQLLEIEEIDFETFRNIVDWVTYRSHAFRIESAGVDANNRVIARCIGIINRTGETVAIPYWRQY